MANGEQRGMSNLLFAIRRSRFASLQPFRRVEGRDDDVLIASTTTQIAGNRDPYLLFGRVRIVAQELDQRRQHARRAEAALEAMVFMERLLQRMQSIRGRRDAFDGEELMSVRLHREHQAGPRRAAIEEDGASAAHAMLTALGLGHASG